MSSEKLISIVIPAFNEEQNIIALYNELISVLQKISFRYEIIFVDDGSRDNTFNEIKKIAEKDKCVSGISLSRNFGHQVAIMAGLQQAKGDLVIMMDADLQHPPDAIPLMIEEQEKGFDIVNTKRIDAKGTALTKKTTSKLFYNLLNKLSDVRIEPAAADFRLMTRKAVDAFLRLEERDRFTRGLISWMGFKQTVIEYQASARFAGKSKYTVKKMFRFGMDGITSFSSKPLRISFYIGFIVFLIGLAYSVYAIIEYILNKTVPGWTSMLVSVLIIGGIQLLSIGIVGEYIARIFNEAKRRPLYFVKDRTISEE
ncbi:MAG TPA: glycosyltransferase family 2 protein [Bacteroidales bacterium]|nr:glycosyltransferase family 2 protein [Bacteroidales bacterium]HPS16817.1 glycosyltransferase family 2 protein [Bacteroidales bacterium]